jgi:cell division protein FtsB
MSQKKSIARSLPVLRRRLSHKVKQFKHDVAYELKIKRKKWLFTFGIFGIYTVAMFSAIALFAAEGLDIEAWAMLASYLVMCAVLKLYFFGSIYGKGGSIHRWALEEQEKQLIQKNAATTAEEMEALMAAHMKAGNIEEADRISKQLLALAEGNQDELYQPAEPADQVIKISEQCEGGLPSWMDNSAPSNAAPEPEKTKLPSWMDD